MRDVAARAGVSQPFLSDLENGRAMPSITTLYRLADTFGLTPQHLLPMAGEDVVVSRSGADRGDPDSHDSPVDPDSAVSPGNPVDLVDPVEEAPGVTAVPLVPPAPGRLIEAKRYTLEADLPAGAWYEHEGEEMVFVLEGTMRVEFGNGVEEPLEAGDALWHSGLLPHRWRTAADAPAKVLLVKGRRPAAGPEVERDHGRS
jgi:quercetin dioxygenase-like cupin family protein/DNA-binding XRE family transcriptional regulator